MAAVSSSRRSKNICQKRGQGKKVLKQSEHRLEKNLQTQSVSEGSEFIKSKEQR